MLLKRFATMTAAVMLWAVVPYAWAIDVTPMVARITPSGPGASYRLSVRNTSSTPITVEIQPYQLAVDEDGGRTLTEENADLVAFPPQSIIPPNREQVVQVRYVGDPTITNARMYLVRAAQLPVPMASDTSEAVAASVMVAFNVNTHVFVAPPTARPNVSVVSTRRDANGDILLVVRNTGDDVAQLRRARYRLTPADGETVEVPPSLVMMGQVSALPGGAVRNMRIPAASAPAGASDVAASIELL